MLTIDDVRAAARRIATHAVRTPLLRVPALDRAARGEVLLKCESLQRTGAFKFRGACNAIASMQPEERAKGVFAYSSGNHAQAVALAARLHGIPATILMPDDAPASKVAGTLAHGAEVVRYDRFTQDRTAIAEELARDRGLPLVRPFDDERVMAGQGTAALEAFDDLLARGTPPDLLVTPLGGGGLLSGCATVARALVPDCRVVGVEPEAGDDVRRSLAAGKRIQIPVPHTIADGLQTDLVGERTFPVLQARVDDVVTVTDDELTSAMARLFEDAKLVVEPSGAAALAAILAGTIDLDGRRALVVLSGGNVDLARFVQLVQPAG